MIGNSGYRKGGCLLLFLAGTTGTVADMEYDSSSKCDFLTDGQFIHSDSQQLTFNRNTNQSSVALRMANSTKDQELEEIVKEVLNPILVSISDAGSTSFIAPRSSCNINGSQ